MIILLDIDGVLVTTPPWRPTESLADGFMRFNDYAAKYLHLLIEKTGADIVLTSTHRINYSIEGWKNIFSLRGIHTNSISRLNQIKTIQDMLSRAIEIKEWFDNEGAQHNFVIIDDDPSLNDFPLFLKQKWVKTKPLIGFNEEAMTEAFKILQLNIQ